MQTDEEITCRIRRNELLGLLHAEDDRITARMPAVTLEHLLVDEEPPPPRRASGTGPVRPLIDGAIVEDDIEPEISVAISRVTSQATNATIEKAIDEAVAERFAEIDREAAEAVAPASYRSELLPMFVGFLVTLVVGLGLMAAI